MGNAKGHKGSLRSHKPINRSRVAARGPVPPRSHHSQSPAKSRRGKGSSTTLLVLCGEVARELSTSFLQSLHHLFAVGSGRTIVTIAQEPFVQVLSGCTFLVVHFKELVRQFLTLGGIHEKIEHTFFCSHFSSFLR